MGLGRHQSWLPSGHRSTDSLGNPISIFPALAIRYANNYNPSPAAPTAGCTLSGTLGTAPAVGTLATIRRSTSGLLGKGKH
jgi:hypothetical protein